MDSQPITKYRTQNPPRIKSSQQKKHIGSLDSNYPFEYQNQTYTSPISQKSYRNEEVDQIKAENTKIKRQLKQAQAKRNQITKQCSELANKCERLQQENSMLQRRIKDSKELQSSQKFQYEQLKFLNRQLNSEIEQLQRDNQQLADKLRQHTDIIQRKYESLEEKTYKNIEQAVKRLKKSISYLSSLSAKDIQKTKDMQVESLRRCIQILKGKGTDNEDMQQQIQQLMNPIRNIQDDLHQKSKDAQILKQQNAKLSKELKKHKKIQKQLLPQYKQAINKLKKNLVQVRQQLSENEYEKAQLKAKYEQKIKQVEIKLQELVKQNRKLKVENKIFEKKLQQIQQDVEQEKQRLIGENEMLKKLYKSEDHQSSKLSYQKDFRLQNQQQDEDEKKSQDQRQNKTQTYSYKTATHNFRKKVQKKALKYPVEKEESNQKYLKKNYSASQLRVSREKQHRDAIQNYKQRQKQRQITRVSKLPQRNPQAYLELNKKSISGQRRKPQKQNIELDYYQANADNEQYQVEDEYDDSQQNDQNLQQQSSGVLSISQNGLQSQILKIDQQIMQIQKNLSKQLNMYR